MSAKPYYFIYFLDSDFVPEVGDDYISLFPAGYLIIGEGTWPEKGSHLLSNAYFSLNEAKEALYKINSVLGINLKVAKNHSSKLDLA